jgi:FKBP-type peptidyl-prolyl cis-trans isomerase (trigger factor)
MDAQSNPPPFDLKRCRDLTIERPVVEVLEDDVTAAFRTLARSTPELADKGDFQALARLLGFDDALSLRREVRTQLERQAQDMTARLLRQRVLQPLLESFQPAADPAAVRLEVASLVREAQDLGQHFPPGKVEQVVVPVAEMRVRSAALVKSLANALGLEPSEAQILRALERHAESYRDPDAVLAHLKRSTAAAKPVVDELVENLVVEGVLRHAQVVDKPTSLDDLALEIHRLAAEHGGG